MTRPRDGQGLGGVLALGMVLLGGLCFAAGVVVGRNITCPDTGKAAKPAGRPEGGEPDDRAQAEELIFPRVLESDKPEAGELIPAPSPPAKKPPVAKSAKAEVRNEARNAGSTGQKAVREKKEDSSKGAYCLQVAAYREKAQARQLAEKLRAGKLPAVRIVKSEVPGKGTYWRVRLGNFASREEADTYRRKLAVEMALDSMVVKQQ